MEEFRVERMNPGSDWKSDGLEGVTINNYGSATWLCVGDLRMPPSLLFINSNIIPPSPQLIMYQGLHGDRQNNTLTGQNQGHNPCYRAPSMSWPARIIL